MLHFWSIQRQIHHQRIAKQFDTFQRKSGTTADSSPSILLTVMGPTKRGGSSPPLYTLFQSMLGEDDVAASSDGEAKLLQTAVERAWVCGRKGATTLPHAMASALCSAFDVQCFTHAKCPCLLHATKGRCRAACCLLCTCFMLFNICMRAACKTRMPTSSLRVNSGCCRVGLSIGKPARFKPAGASKLAYEAGVSTQPKSPSTSPFFVFVCIRQ